MNTIGFRIAAPPRARGGIMMAHSSALGSQSQFSRCGKCGTPNPARPYITNCLGCGTRLQAGTGTAATATRAPRGRWLAALSVAYAVFLLVVLGLMRWLGGDWWVVS